MIELNDTYIQADNIVTRKVMGEVMLVPIRGEIAAMDNVFTLNQAGYFIWSLLDGITSVRSISNQMKTRYDAPLSIIETDVCALIDDLSSAGLLRRCQY